jgi:hypothetical protein
MRKLTLFKVAIVTILAKASNLLTSTRALSAELPNLSCGNDEESFVVIRGSQQHLGYYRNTSGDTFEFSCRPEKIVVPPGSADFQYTIESCRNNSQQLLVKVVAGGFAVSASTSVI